MSAVIATPGDKHAAKIIGCPLDVFLRHRMAGQKWCPQCPGWRPMSAFGRNRSRYDGVHGWCRACAQRHRGQPKLNRWAPR